MRSRLDPSAIVVLVLLGIVWSWWAWKQGAYFGTVAFPGTILLCAGLVLLTRVAPWRAGSSLSRPAAIALVALVALGVWAAVSALWSPAPDIAIRDGQRVLVYAMSFGLGVWLCSLLGSRPHLAMAPLAIAAAVAGIATVITVTGDDHVRQYLEVDGTLDFPLGYRNANAAFFAIAIWPCVGLAQSRDLDWRLRGIALGAGTLSIDLALLSQSRGSVLGGAAALAVYVGVSTDRARAVAWLALATLPALLVIPSLTNLFHTANEGGLAATTGAAHTALTMAAVAGAVATLAGAAVARLGRRWTLSAPAQGRANRIVGIAAIAMVIAGLVGFLVAIGNPSDWIGQRVQQFKSGESPAASGGSRFSFNAGSDRVDLWRVALDDVADEPLLGDGGGGYRYSYVLNRNSDTQTAHDAHSVELELLSELGVPGLALLAVALVAAATGALRSRRLGPGASALSTVALAAGAYWLAHTSLDWFWPYPAVTAPVMALLGSACAPAMLRDSPTDSRRARRWVAVGAVVLAVSVVPSFLADRYTNDAYATWRTDLGRAYADLDAAHRLDPLSVQPLLVEGAIARAAGQRQRAIEAFREAADKRPEEWASFYYLGDLQTQSDPRAARRDLDVAASLNPLSARVDAAQRALRQSRRQDERGGGSSG